MSDTANLRRLAASQPRTILLEDSRPSSARSFFFQSPVEWLEVHTLDDLPGLFTRIQTAQAEGLWAAGYLSYECGLHFEPKAVPHVPGPIPLAAFGLYTAPNLFTARPTPEAPSSGLNDLPFNITPEAFTAKIAQIHRWIEAGDTYQLNLTDRILAELPGTPAELFAHMMQTQPVEFGAFLNLGDGQTILSASPELFFHLDQRHITVRPMKGTAPRGRTPEEDALNAQTLAADPKNRAENLMIADLMRSDLGRIAEMGSVRVDKLFHVEPLPSLLQMTTEISATLRPEITPYDLFAALFPAGSIVGAPKLRSMQLLRTLEARNRGVYTGSIGFFSPHGEAVFSVAIRTAVLHGKQLEMGIGAGITYDSDPAAEYAECLLKAEFLREAPTTLIETMRWENGTCTLLPLHLDRLEASANHFKIPFDREAILKTLQQADPSSPTRLRLTLNRTGINLTSAPIHPDPPALKAMLWPKPVTSTDPFLRHKTTRRALYDQAHQAATAQGCIDAIFQNEQGHLTEGAIHNLFLRHGGLWRTPPLESGVLPGVYRRHLLETQPHIQQAILTLADLRSADEIWLTNAVRGIRNVELEPPFPAF
ncbi:aminodeoxychorismate synthase component I [Granulicella tundricola]|uniref:Para-aminobenzoate synthase, subunit I n=1 Tax=Granulicella tundricola (strain ATCC BAA-1859 / DSM 23138 / MP5ACTX9) TaxID=1198114 RepID=E8WXA6_GRATM|nr:aminodeoxychorismate synthase component I [Granulicella tundricola]ADW67439.1 para-aminobenzoate synthase, subunit I [Granulicella tundricola MP5ACTX9]